MKDEKKTSAVGAQGNVNLNKVPFGTRVRPYLIVAPSLILTIGIMVPFVIAIYYSLTSYSFRMPIYKFVGLQNWVNLLTDPAFWHSVRVTLEYAVISIIIEMLLGLGIAILLNNLENRFSKMMKVALVFPLMVAPVVATIIWTLMLSNTVGVVEHLLNLFGVYGFPWQASPKTAMMTAIMIDVWVNTGFVILLALAGLQGLPKSPFESAQIDGGSTLFNFRNLTLPMIKPSLYIAFLFRFMAALQEYAIVYGLTKGGPGDTLMNMSLSAYQTGFQFMKVGSSLPYILVLWMFINFCAKRIVKMQRHAQNVAAGKEDD